MGPTNPNPYIPSQSLELREANMPVRSDTACDAQGADSSTHLCSAVLETQAPGAASNGVSACFGDSGGPLLGTAIDGTLGLIGVTSYGGSGCVSSSFTGAYVKIDAYRPWIESITGPVSGTTRSPAPPPTPGPVFGGGGGGGASGALTLRSPAAGAVHSTGGVTQVT